MPAFYQPCWFCHRALRVDRDFEWTTIRVGWTGQKPNDVEVMVHVACAPRAKAVEQHYQELKAMISKHVGAMKTTAACLLFVLSSCATHPQPKPQDLPPIPPAVGRTVSEGTARSSALRRAAVVSVPVPPSTLTFNGRVVTARFAAGAGPVVFWSSTNLVDWVIIGRFDRTSVGTVLLRDETATNRSATFYRISR